LLELTNGKIVLQRQTFGATFLKHPVYLTVVSVLR